MHIPTFDSYKNMKMLQKNMIFMSFASTSVFLLTMLLSERPKVRTILAFLSGNGFMSKKKHPLNACLAFHFLFPIEQVDQNGEKRLGYRGGGEGEGGGREVC